MKNRYKAFKIKNTRVSFGSFRKERVKLSNVYKTGFHVWDSDIDKNYSLVVWLFRVVFSIDKKHCGESHCGESSF